ncbi:MAG TPA: D-2-hydroxyacid dehydrogenase family protein [Thermodesulfobacteriota bacterium]
MAILDDLDRLAARSPAIARLRQAPGIEVEVIEEHLEPPELAARLAGVPVVIPIRERTRFDDALLARLPDLEMISQTGTGVNHIDLDACRRRGVRVATTTHEQGSLQSVLELVFGLLFAVSRRIARLDAEMRQGRWPRFIGREMAGSTLGILGLGAIGQAVARVGRAFDLEPIAWGPTLTPERAAAAGVEYVEKDDLFRRSDILSIHLRLSNLSRGMVGAREIGLMKPTAILINTARGPIVDEAALVDALREGRLAGAGLDVFSTEPLPPGSPLTTLENVVLTPHIGWPTHETYERFFAGAAENVLAWREGRPVHWLVEGAV